MRTLLCSWICLATVSLASAQTQTLGPPVGSPGSGMPPSYGQPQSPPANGVSLPQAQPTNSYGQPGAKAPLTHNYATQGAPVVEGCPVANCCPPANCEACQGCVRVPSTKTITRVTYWKKCEEFCVPNCCCLASLFGDCSHCDGPWVKYRLVKRVTTETCPITKCVPAAMAAPCGPSAGPLPK
jgi:hypothetical protein